MGDRLVVASRFALGLILALGALAACAGSPPGDASPAPRRPADPAGIAAIDGANLLVRGSRAAAADVSPEELAAIGRANAEFAVELFREIAGEAEGNLVVGPHSIWSALSMIFAGARGETATEMAEVLRFDRPQDEITPLLNALDLTLAGRNDPGAVELRIANQVFAQPGFALQEEYLTTLTRDFGAPLAELAFADVEAARRVINAWAAERTNDRIKELFPPGSLSPQTVLVLCNTVSLDGAWTYRFDPEHTMMETFKPADGPGVAVPMMHFNLYLPLADAVGVQAVELPYGDGELSMVALLPDDMESFVADLTAARLEEIFGAIREQGIHLSLPKFTFRTKLDLVETLGSLGMSGAFGAGADFSGMTGSPGLFLDAVRHEAFIEVDEQGTEAHAATGGSMALSHGPTITFDRPFLFVIRDRPTGAVLFVGRVSNPAFT